MLASTRRICRRAFQEYSNMPLDSGPLKKYSVKIIQKIIVKLTGYVCCTGELNERMKSYNAYCSNAVYN